IRPGPEGDDVDSCGMNMIGKIPQGCEARGSLPHAHGKRNRPPQDLILSKVSKLSLQVMGALL
ncbi:hypothetical protein ACTWP7_09005, partial [Halobacillus sp. B29]